MEPLRFLVTFTMASGSIIQIVAEHSEDREGISRRYFSLLEKAGTDDRDGQFIFGTRANGNPVVINKDRIEHLEVSEEQP